MTEVEKTAGRSKTSACGKRRAEIEISFLKIRRDREEGG